jgi:hypothetical protein
MKCLPPIGWRRTVSVILLNVVFNTVVGFCIFASGFNNQDFGLTSIAVCLCFTGMIIGIPSGVALRVFQFHEVILAVLPLLSFFLLFVGGSVEKGGAREIRKALLILAMPLAFQGGSWFLGTLIAKRLQK